MKTIYHLRDTPVLKRLSILLITAALVAGMPGCRLQLIDPIEIRTWYDLHAIRDDINAHYILMNDLDSTTDGYTELAGPTADSGQGWLPLRQAGSEHFGWYAGVFDGQGYEIRDLFINRPDMDKVGLFGQIYRLGEIRNVRLVNASVTGSEVVGGLVGMMWRDDPAYGLTNCYFSGNVTGTAYVGGLVGDNALGTVSNSYATGNVTGNDGVGGLVGLNRENGIVDDSYATGSVTGNDFVGGLVGSTSGTVSNSYATGSVTGELNTIGGLVGSNGGTVSNSYAEGSVTGGERVGGLVGSSGGTVSHSYSTGSVTAYDSVGGLLGSNWGTVSDSYATGSVTGDSYVGGLMGSNEWLAKLNGMPLDGGIVSNSYATGSVAGSTHVGGLVGVNEYVVTDSCSTGSVSGSLHTGGLVGTNAGTVSNSHYNYSEVLINGENVITVGALFHDDFEQWLANGKFLDVTERLDQEGDYYVINDVGDFKQLLAFGQYEALNFRLKDDIDLGSDPGLYIPYLAGKFDGSGHRISNLSLNSDFISGVGLFGHLVWPGTVNDVGVEGVNIRGAANVGGLVGRSSGTVRNSYSSGNVTGDECAGGIVGYKHAGLVSDCYSSGSVSGPSVVGGLVGYNSPFGEVAGSYAIAHVTGSENIGGLVGYNDSGTVTVSFWDIETSGQAGSAGGTGKSTAEMQSITTFTDKVWDIVLIGDYVDETWYIDDGNDYPRLGWQYP